MAECRAATKQAAHERAIHDDSPRGVAEVGRGKTTAAEEACPIEAEERRVDSLRARPARDVWCECDAVHFDPAAPHRPRRSAAAKCDAGDGRMRPQITHDCIDSFA